MAKIKLKGVYEVLRGLNGMGIADKHLFDNLSSMGEINVSRYGISPTQYTLTSDPLKNKAVTVANIREVDSMSKVFNGSRIHSRTRSCDKRARGTTPENGSWI